MFSNYAGCVFWGKGEGKVSRCQRAQHEDNGGGGGGVEGGDEGREGEAERGGGQDREEGCVCFLAA